MRSGEQRCLLTLAREAIGGAVQFDANIATGVMVQRFYTASVMVQRFNTAGLGTAVSPPSPGQIRFFFGSVKLIYPYQHNMAPRKVKRLSRTVKAGLA